MSLIFNALQRFGRSENALTQKQDTGSTVRHAYSLRRLFLSAPVILAIGGLIGISGVLAVEAARSFSTKASSPTAQTQPVSRPSETAMPIRSESTAPADIKIISQPSVAAASSRSEDNQTGDATGEFAGEAPGAASQVRFFPPEPAALAVDEADQTTVVEQTAVAAPPVPALPAQSPGRPTVPAKPGRMPALAANPPDPAVVVQAPAPLSLTSRLIPPTTSAGQQALPAADPKKADPEAAANLAEDALRHRQAARAAHHLRTDQLVNRINAAIGSENHTLAAKLLGQLEKTIGSGHVYVQKLRAFWQIRQNNLDEARRLLHLVLAQQPEDRESGLNMAVIDIRCGRYSDARRRLKALHELYPEDGRIGTFLRQLAH